MKTILLSLAAAAALSAPAAAQYSDRARPSEVRDYPSRGVGVVGNDYPARIEQLRARLRTGVQNGAIDRREAAELRQQLRQVSDLEARYSANGLSAEERADLQDELRDIRQDVRLAETRNQYAEGEDAVDEPRYDRNGRLIRDPEPTQRRTLGGIIDGVVGGGSNPK